ncbi:hypothetical protein Tco_1075073 [Tanacetum coccineum]
MPVELGSFNVIIGMDWLRRCHAVIVCDEKLVQVPYGNETLTFYGNENSNGRESRLTIISCLKAQEYMAKGCQVFLAQISTKKEEDKSEGKQIKDVPIYDGEDDERDGGEGGGRLRWPRCYNADYQLAQRLQAEELEQFTTEQKATLFKELLEQRRKHFAAKRAEEKRNKPPTENQQKKTMITYIKNMEGWKDKDLKSKDIDSIKELFDKAFKRVNMFVDYRTDLVEGSSKRAGDELEQEVTKKKKVDDVQETTEVDDDQEASKIKELMEIVPDKEEVAINAIYLATKPPTIVDWKIHKEGKKNYY